MCEQETRRDYQNKISTQSWGSCCRAPLDTGIDATSHQLAHFISAPWAAQDFTHSLEDMMSENRTHGTLTFQLCSCLAGIRGYLTEFLTARSSSPQSWTLHEIRKKDCSRLE